MASFWHKKSIEDILKSSGQTGLVKFNNFDMTTPVKLNNHKNRFEARLSFDLYDWAFADAISKNEVSIKSLDLN